MLVGIPELLSVIIIIVVVILHIRVVTSMDTTLVDSLVFNEKYKSNSCLVSSLDVILRSSIL